MLDHGKYKRTPSQHLDYIRFGGGYRAKARAFSVAKHRMGNRVEVDVSHADVARATYAGCNRLLRKPGDRRRASTVSLEVPIASSRAIAQPDPFRLDSVALGGEQAPDQAGDLVFPVHLFENIGAPPCDP